MCGVYVGGWAYVFLRLCVFVTGWVTLSSLDNVNTQSKYLFAAVCGLVSELLHVTFDLHIPVSPWLSRCGLHAHPGQADHERWIDCYHLSVYARYGTSAIESIYKYDKCPYTSPSESLFRCTASLRH